MLIGGVSSGGQVWTCLQLSKWIDIVSYCNAST